MVSEGQSQVRCLQTETISRPAGVSIRPTPHPAASPEGVGSGKPRFIIVASLEAKVGYAEKRWQAQECGCLLRR